MLDRYQSTTLRLLPAGATVAGWDIFLPLDRSALFTAHVGETDTLELLRLGVAASEPQCSAVLGYCSHNVDESALRDLGFDFRGYLYR